MINQRTSIKFIQVTTDLILLAFSFLTAVYFSNLHPTEYLTIKQQFIFALLIAVWYISAKPNGIYDEFRARDFSFELIAIIKNIFLQAVVAVFIMFLIKEIYLKRIFILNYSVILLGTMSIFKFSQRRYLNYLRRRGRNLRQLLIVGAGKVGQNFYNSVLENPHFGYKLIGFLDDSHKSMLNGKYLGTIDELEKVLDRNRIDDVIITLPNYASERLEWVIGVCEQYTTRVKIIPDYFKFLSERYEISSFGHFPVISVRNDKLNVFHWRLIKRGLDAIFAVLFFLLISSWLFPLIALLIKIDSKGPVFFKQERWGRNNKRFLAFKFRSMKMESKDLDNKGKYNQAKKNDSRITKIGSFLRRTNLDELPQFINVLKGEMSLVGPRPHPTPLNLESKDKIRYYMLRHLVKPGITGWAQVNGSRGETETEEKMQARINHDLWYIENWSFWLDIQIIFLTIWLMLKGDKNAY